MKYLVRHYQRNFDGVCDTPFNDLPSALAFAADILGYEICTSCGIWENGVCLFFHIKE